MTFWRQAMAIVLLMVFTPASLLAGTPLRLCAGEDGHRAVEFVLSASHHATDHDATNHDATDHDIAYAEGEVADNAVVLGDATDCTDSPLLTAVQKPSSDVFRTIVSSLDQWAVVATDTPSVLAAASVDRSRPAIRALDVAVGNPQLDALRTVVLLI